jgi:hypothetical protein
MNMVVLAVELDQFGFKVITYTGKDFPQIVEDLFGEDLAPIFCDEEFIRYVEMANLLPTWKSEFPWLRESPSFIPF